MTIAASMLPEFVQEMKTTRPLIERVPDALGDWKPHPKSTSMGALAVHIAALVGWVPAILANTELDFALPESRRMMPPWTDIAAALAVFDEGVRAGRDGLAGMSDEAMMTPWTLRNGSHVIVTMPRVAALRTLVLNHVIHHRGQLSVYLRLNDIPLPSIYGPTADSAN